MKNIIIIGSLLLFTAANSFAQDELAYNDINHVTSHKLSKAQKEENRTIRKEKAVTEPNYTTEQHFLTDFPGATNVSWKINGFEEALFTLNGKEMKAFYDYNNELVGTTSEVSYFDMPEIARKYIEKHYKDYTTQQVILFDDNEYNDTDMMLYGNHFEDEDNYFVELSNNNKKIVLQVNMEGLVTFFKDLSYSNVK
ncbi:hypothetical protein A3860_34030 [Niastella vici]|uniref:Beta-lactamase-inhibitor-like PepSY-like domain-containing protein n=1 Tax=Niastella vici TaxID=1703345 RepID=A0A1V9FPZ6_9BACT|nr:hypothetical protein [Niastella vici]OQP60400.1 hypothetical protein A3860_34030 [Niastella vici]